MRAPAPRRLAGLAALAAAAIFAGAARAAPLRVPLTGAVYLEADAPAGWATTRSANAVEIDGPHVSVTLAVLEDKSLQTATEAELATALMRSLNGPPPDDAGAVQVAGLGGERFRGTLRNGGGQTFPVEVRVARIDATRMAVENLAWQPGAPDDEIDQAWKIVQTSRLARPAAQQAAGAATRP